jgi:hypothetical protein
LIVCLFVRLLYCSAERGQWWQFSIFFLALLSSFLNFLNVLQDILNNWFYNRLTVEMLKNRTKKAKPSFKNILGMVGILPLQDPIYAEEVEPLTTAMA